jgi:hypothetical protein
MYIYLATKKYNHLYEKIYQKTYLLLNNRSLGKTEKTVSPYMVTIEKDIGKHSISILINKLYNPW